MRVRKFSCPPGPWRQAKNRISSRKLVFSTADNADIPTGPIAQTGDKVTFTYEVTNTGNVPLTITELIDDNGTPVNSGDDFMPVLALKPNGKNFGDDNDNDLLDVDEAWYFQAMRLATQPGQQKNTAKVTAAGPATTPFGSTVTMDMDSDMSHHLVNPLQFEKYVFVAPEPQAGDVCDTLGNPRALNSRTCRARPSTPLRIQARRRFFSRAA